MKPFRIALCVLILAAASVVGFSQPAGPPGPTIQQRGRMIFEAAEAEPVNAAALREALHDIGHVQGIYRSQPLKRWVDGARIIDGRIHLTSVVGLNRLGRGAAPDEWIEKLTAPLKTGQKLSVLRLAFAAPPEVGAQRDRILAQADERIRAGLLAMANEYPQLGKTNWGTLAEALEGKARAGRVSIWAGHYQGGKGGLREAVPKNASYNVFVLLQPLHWPVPSGEWAMQQKYSHLALMGQVHADAGAPELRAALKKLVADALAPLERLSDDAASGRATTQPTTQPAPAPPPATARAADPVKELRDNVDRFGLLLQYSGPQDKPYYQIALYVSADPRALKVEGERPADELCVQISKGQATRIVDHIAAEGLRSVGNLLTDAVAMPKGPAYLMTVGYWLPRPSAAPARGVSWLYDLGWGLPMLKRLDGLRKVLEGDSAEAMDTLLGRLSGHRRQWAAEAGGQ